MVEAPGYNISKARAPVWVISVPSPFVTLSLNRVPDTFAENGGQATQQLVARVTLGMPRGVEVAARIGTRGKGSSELSATSGEDFESVGRTVVIPEDAYELQEGWWVARADLSLALFDDDMREGTETFELTVQPPSDQSEKVQFLNSDGTRCWGRCKNLMYITDEEDTPALDLSVSADEIMEEGETSSAAMVSSTNGKSFAVDQLVTLSLDGTATMGADYTVSPADVDEGSPGFQVVLPGESTSTEVTIKAMSDNVDDPNEKIEVSASLDGDAIGNMQAVRIMNQEMPLPKISVAANRATIIGSMENLVLTLTREEPLSERLTVTVQLAQDQEWLPWTSCPVTFQAGAASASVTIPHSNFSTNVVASGNLTNVGQGGRWLRHGQCDGDRLRRLAGGPRCQGLLRPGHVPVWGRQGGCDRGPDRGGRCRHAAWHDRRFLDVLGERNRESERGLQGGEPADDHTGGGFLLPERLVAGAASAAGDAHRRRRWGAAARSSRRPPPRETLTTLPLRQGLRNPTPLGRPSRGARRQGCAGTSGTLELWNPGTLSGSDRYGDRTMML